MGKYLFLFSYTREGLAGLLQEGGSRRREVARQLAESVGGKLEAYYFAFGEFDGVAIIDAPDNVSATTASLTVNASGAVSVRTVVLLTPEEVDAATQKSAAYRPPGA